MAYQTYITEAVVCGSRTNNTSDKAYLLFTRDAGMLWANARSVREERSRQRYALQDFSVIRASLVSGKSGWRIGSVQAITNPFMEAEVRNARVGLRDLIRMTRRFVQGQEAQKKVFDDLVMVMSCITEATEEDINDLIDQFILRMLHTLGYIAPHAAFRHLLEESDPWSVPIAIPQEARRAIENALTVSHL